MASVNVPFAQQFFVHDQRLADDNFFVKIA